MRILVVGFGVVGRGLVKLLPRAGGVTLVGICERKGCLYDEEGINLQGLAEAKLEELRGFSGELTSLECIREKEFDVLVELTPTNIENGEPGITFIETALARGKSVVTSNKGPIALAFKRLDAIAEEKGALLRFEATVGGAIPLFSLARNCLRANRIKSIEGIINGTTNFILTKMEKEKRELKSVLKQAQEMGIAEADPSYDIDGIDAAAKAVIMANVLMGREITLADVKRQGIADITLKDIESALMERKRIRLLARVGEEVSVEPVRIPFEHPLASVEGVMNAVSMETDVASFTLMGPGAGQIPTASAVLNDLLEVKKELNL